MDYIPLISIPIIYILVALIKPHIQAKLPFNLCAICVAVSLTWLILAAVWLFVDLYDYDIQIGILMGMSIVGLMYKFESYFKQQKLQHFWFVRLILILGGFYSINLFLEKNWNMLALVVITGVLSVAIVTFLLQSITHTGVFKKLDDCC